MSAWTFPVVVTSSCEGGVNGGYTYVEMATQSTATYPLPAPVWTNPTSLTSPFIVPKITIEGGAEAGAIGIGSITLECGNEVLHSGGDRIYDIIRGNGNTGTFDVDTTDLHVRIWWKPDAGSSYMVRFWGVVDFSSISVKIGDFTDPDTWVVSFNADDCLSQLERTPTHEFVDTTLTHATYDKTVDNIFLTFIGDYAFSGYTYRAGRYLLVNKKYNDGLNKDWITQFTNPKTGDVTDLPFVWFKLTSIFDALTVHFGLEAATNNGDAWNTRHTWRFYYNTANSTGSGGTTLSQTDIDGLYIISAAYPLYDGNVTVYSQAQTLFDRDSGSVNNPASLMRAATPYDMLKRLCVSLGLIASIRVNASGQRYLDIREAAMPSTIIDYGTDGLYSVDAEMSPYKSTMTGIEVVSPYGENVLRGSNGNGSKKLDTIFNVCNFARQDHDFRRSVKDFGNTSGGAYLVAWGNDVSHDFFSSLWVMTGATSAINFTNCYSVCAIAVRSDSMRSPSNAYIEQVASPVGPYPYGKFQTVFGGLGIDNVLYPSDDSPANIQPTVPAQALSHYYFSPQQMGLPAVGHQASYDDVGLFRSKGRELRIKRAGINGDIPYPGSTMEIVMNGITNTYYVRSVTEDHQDNVTEYTLEMWGVA